MVSSDLRADAKTRIQRTPTNMEIVASDNVQKYGRLDNWELWEIVRADLCLTKFSISLQIRGSL